MNSKELNKKIADITGDTKKKAKKVAGRVNKTEQLKKAAIQALYQNKGNVSSACAACGIGRTQFYLWKNEDKEFEEAVNNVTDFCIDHVESKLHDNIDNGDTTAIIFYLKTIGKKRGYIEKSEVDHSGELTVKQITGMIIK